MPFASFTLMVAAQAHLAIPGERMTRVSALGVVVGLTRAAGSLARQRRREGVRSSHVKAPPTHAAGEAGRRTSSGSWSAMLVSWQPLSPQNESLLHSTRIRCSGLPAAE